MVDPAIWAEWRETHALRRESLHRLSESEPGDPHAIEHALAWLREHADDEPPR